MEPSQKSSTTQPKHWNEPGLHHFSRGGGSRRKPGCDLWRFHAACGSGPNPRDARSHSKEGIRLAYRVLGQGWQWLALRSHHDRDELSDRIHQRWEIRVATLIAEPRRKSGGRMSLFGPETDQLQLPV